MPVLFLKANPNHDLRGRFARGVAARAEGAPTSLPASGSIASKEGALAYWGRHLEGKTFDVNMRTGKGIYSISVEFPLGNHHAWTRAALRGETPDVYDQPRTRKGGRVFDPDRSRFMDRLLPTIQNAWKVLGQDKDDVVIQAGQMPDGRSYTIALTIKGRGRYEMKSAYPRTPTEISDLTKRFRPRAPAGLPANVLQKSEPPPSLAGGAYGTSLTGPSGPTPRGLFAIAPDEEARYPLAAGQYIGVFCELFKALPAGARWITVRPNGPGTQGQAVMIQPAADGAYRVVGGAGGRLNYLKLTGVKSEVSYKQEAQQRHASRQDERKRQRERDQKDGLAESKGKAREAIKAQIGDEHAKFVKTVADALGWTEKDMRFPEESYQNASEGARRAAAAKHGAELFRRAKQAVDQQRQMLLQDGEARQAAGLGEVKLTGEAPDELTVQDLDPVQSSTQGLGFSADYGKRAEEQGLTKEGLAAEKEAAKPPPPSDGKPAPGEVRKATAAKIATELKGIQDPGPQMPQTAAIDAKKAVELLKAEKALRQVEKQAREKRKLVDTAKAPVEPKAYVLETGGPVDTDVTKDLENDLRTLKTRAFLEGIGKIAGGEESLGRHIGVGAYNAVNALSLAATGASLVDRSVVDVLGVAGAAQVVARRLHSDLTPDELENVKQAMGRFHVDHYMHLSDESLRQARDWQEAAAEIELGEAQTGGDLATMQELNAKRRDLTQNAQRVLGTSLGEMEANAAMVLALEQSPKKQVQASLGSTSIESAIQQARAIGLDRGDYQVERVGASTILTVTGAGMDKLAQPVAKADLERTRTALSIINGQQDEDDWLPQGVARRPEMAMNAKPGAAPRLAKPFPQVPADMDRAVSDYIGGRMADGDAPAEIMEGLLSEDAMQKAGDRGAFMAAVNKLAPLYDADGKMIRAESHQAAFEKMADDFVERTYGAERTPLHRQQFPVDQVAAESLHQALAKTPEGVAAFKPIGELTPQDQAALRSTFAAEYGRSDPAAEGMRTDLAKMDAAEPEKETEDMFGRSVNPAWREWQSSRNDLAEKLNKASMTWSKYLETMGSPANAYASMQDVLKSKLLKDFADHHNTLRPGAPIKVGKSVIANDLNHLDALDPVARDRRRADRQDLVDSLRSRVAGRYAAGSVSDKMDAARAAEEAANQAQMGLFGMDEPAAGKEGEAPAPKAPELGERYTIGHAAERQIAGMMPIIGKNFKPGQPVHIWQPTMSGKYVGRQRAVKLIKANKRTELGMGTGSGKTSIMLSAFTDLKGEGNAHRGLFLVPSIVQGQFHGEALTLLEPGKFNWHADPGATREQRIAAYKDPKTDFNVVTHQAFRDDMLHLAAKQEGGTPAAIADKLETMTPAERKDYLGAVMKAEGIDHDYLAVDEGHNLLNRAGKENSRMANVVDAVSGSMPYYTSATADPVKNDASEAFDVLAKMDPARYSDRDAFMRKYGVDTGAAKEGLKREMARHFYTGKIDPGVKANKREIAVQLDDGQRAQLKTLQDAQVKARLARMHGGVDVDAMRTLSPASFADVDHAQHEAIARKIQASIGIITNMTARHILNGGAKIDAVAKIAADRKGKPGVVFAHSLTHVKSISDRLAKEGHRVVTLSGGDSTAEKDRKKRDYQAGKYDVMVASDAGAVGANLQHGKWLAQLDTPDTAMLHHQRGARIHRMGQTEDVELMDLVADHPIERRARKRLEGKYDLRSIMTSPLEGLDDTGVASYLAKVKAGQMEADEPMHRPATPDEVPEGLSEPDEQQSLF